MKPWGRNKWGLEGFSSVFEQEQNDSKCEIRSLQVTQNDFEKFYNNERSEEIDDNGLEILGEAFHENPRIKEIALDFSK